LHLCYLSDLPRLSHLLTPWIPSVRLHPWHPWILSDLPRLSHLLHLCYLSDLPHLWIPLTPSVRRCLSPLWIPLTLSDRLFLLHLLSQWGRMHHLHPLLQSILLGLLYLLRPLLRSGRYLRLLP
jgi:hypothetical protein